MSTPTRISTGPLVKETSDRMVQIMGLITSTQSTDVRVEYSALMCAAAMLMTISQGIEPSMANYQRVMVVVADQLIPAIEAEVEKMA